MPTPTMQIRASNKPCGVVHFESGNQAYLPFEYVQVHADIVDGALWLFICCFILIDLGYIQCPLSLRSPSNFGSTLRLG